MYTYGFGLVCGDVVFDTFGMYFSSTVDLVRLEIMLCSVRLRLNRLVEEMQKRLSQFTKM